MKKNKNIYIKLKNIFDYYGYNKQVKKLAEEQFELNEQIIKANYSYDTWIYKKDIISEIADNYVLIKQFMFHYSITDEEVLEEAKRKIDRQLKRIEIEKLTK